MKRFTIEVQSLENKEYLTTKKVIKELNKLFTTVEKMENSLTTYCLRIAHKYNYYFSYNINDDGGLNLLFTNYNYFEKTNPLNTLLA